MKRIEKSVEQPTEGLGSLEIVGALWAVTSAMAVALYAQVIGRIATNAQKIEKLEAMSATRDDITEIKNLIRDNTKQTHTMRAEARDSVIQVHARVDVIHQKHSDLAVKVASIPNKGH